MAVQTAILSLDQVKGPYSGSPTASPYHIFRATINLSGTYATGGFQFDLCSFFAGSATAAPLNGARMGVSALAVNWVKAFGDYADSAGVAVTIADGQTALASAGAVTPISAASTNNLVTVKLYTGTANGVGTSELTNATAVSGPIGVLFACQLTYGSLGLL